MIFVINFKANLFWLRVPESWTLLFLHLLHDINLGRFAAVVLDWKFCCSVPSWLWKLVLETSPWKPHSQQLFSIQLFGPLWSVSFDWLYGIITIFLPHKSLVRWCLPKLMACKIWAIQVWLAVEWYGCTTALQSVHLYVIYADNKTKK